MDDGPVLPDAASEDAIQRFQDHLIYAIRSGQLSPGQHLAEADLMRRFGISRGTLREGLRQFSSRGLVTLTRYRGAFLSVLDRHSVNDLLEVLEPLCVLAARLAAQHCTTDVAKERLRQAALALSDATGRGQAGYLENRQEFYDILIDMGGNTELRSVIPLARTDLFRAQFNRVQSKAQHKRHAGGYARIADAVAEGNPAKAERAVRKHFESTRRTLATLPDRALAIFPDAPPRLRMSKQDE